MLSREKGCFQTSFVTIGEIYQFGKKSQKLLFAELGTGSGAISIALALAYPLSHGLATDIDQDALEIATKNYINSSKQSNLKFYCGNWWSPLNSFKGKLCKLI